MIAYLIVYYTCVRNLRGMCSNCKMLVTLTFVFYAAVYCLAHCILTACAKLSECCVFKRKHPTKTVFADSWKRRAASKSLSQLPPVYRTQTVSVPPPHPSTVVPSYAPRPNALLYASHAHLHRHALPTNPSLYYFSLPNLLHPQRVRANHNYYYTGGYQPQQQPVYFYPACAQQPPPPSYQQPPPPPPQYVQQQPNFPGWSDDTTVCLQQLETNYTVGGIIGRGAYSVVYEATHRHLLNKKFAIKRTRYKCAEERARFIEENRLQTIYGQLRCYLCFDDARDAHNCIVSIWDCLRCTLSATLPVLSLFNAAPQLHKKEQLVSRVVYCILRKLHYLHVTGNLIHHDLKPDNILITNAGNPCDRAFDVFIIDYGFSVFNHHELQCVQSEDQRMIPRYTLGYCAWELLDCIERKNVCYTQQIDMYALGVIAMELLLGQNCIVANSARNAFVHAQTQNTMRAQNIGAYEQLNYEKEYAQFMRSCKVKFHREFWRDGKDGTRSMIVTYVVQRLREYGYSRNVQHFVAALLHDDPSQRLNCNDALQHPFIRSQY